MYFILFLNLLLFNAVFDINITNSDTVECEI